MRITLLALLVASVVDVSSAFVVRPSTNINRLHHLESVAPKVQQEGIGKTHQDDVPDSDADDSTRAIIGPTQALIYDTTLRDGTQGESISASCDDKLKIAKRLMSFGVDYVEAGWPGSNPKDAEFFDRAKTELGDRSKLVAFGSTRRKSMAVQDDAQVQALLDSEAPTLCLVAKSTVWQVEEILKTSKEENLAMISETIDYLVNEHGRRVFIDLEHFFDGYVEDPEYALDCCWAAVNAGASSLVLCDTNGGRMPWEIHDIVEQIVAEFDVTIGIHCHNDCGMAVANSVSASKAGAGLIQGTMNGIGERTGNANLCSIIPSLSLHMDTKFVSDIHINEMTSVSRYVDEILNRSPVRSDPFVGSSAFAHKGGLHVAAMERNPLSYQHIEPTLVGNEQRYLISELSGRQNILGKMKDTDENASERASAVLDRVKTLESQGYTFEGAEASVHLMTLHASDDYSSPFAVLDYSVHVENTGGINLDTHAVSKEEVKEHESAENDSVSRPMARATIKVRTQNINDASDDDDADESLPYVDQLEVSEGSGPVAAIAQALKQALVPSHPRLKELELVDYKVRILDPKAATDAATRVLIEFRLGDETWSTVSVDQNIISASLNALVDGFEYAVVEHDDGGGGDVGDLTEM